nr:hypothetical protein [Bacteroides sp. 1001136B_160425_E2]
MTISDSHPLGTLLERELEEEIYKAINKLPSECGCIMFLQLAGSLCAITVSVNL